MNHRATKSIFGSIHLRLGLIALSVVAGFYSLAHLFVAPKLVDDRAQAVLSVIRSHEGDIILNKTRSVRDELLKSGTIREDQQFAHYFSDEKDKVLPLFNDCNFVSPSVCIGQTASIFLAANSDHPPREDFKFAVVLAADLSRPPALLLLWEGIMALITGLAFWLLDRAIAKKEKYLLQRLSVASAAFARARVLFTENPAAGDEFDAFGKSAEDLVRELEEYKAKFERKTRLEQLGLTVGQISHDLKAPLNEADNFLSSLTFLMDTVPRAQIEEAKDSLIKRIRGGKDSLNRALQVTKQTAVAREELALWSVLEAVKDRAKENTKLQGLSFNLSVSSNFKMMGDRLRLETALLNLLENTADEKRNAHVQMAVGPGEAGHIKISYEDNGSGIPEEFLDKIFEPLVTFKAHGSGFGLSSTKEILAQHGGQIRALPNLGGAKFEITLPTLGSKHV